MAKYIDQSVAIARLTHLEVTKPTATMTDAKRALADMFPADVAPVVHGRWKYYHKQNKAVCTRCSFERDLDENFGAAISCPNCGAKMDGAE